MKGIVRLIATGLIFLHFSVSAAGAAAAQIPDSVRAPSDRAAERQRRVEHGLVPRSSRAGNPRAYTILERTAHHGVIAVNVTVIHEGWVGWAVQLVLHDRFSLPTPLSCRSVIGTLVQQVGL